MHYGPEMISHHFMDWARDNEVELLLIQPGKPNQNAYIERFNRSFQTEVLDANWSNSVSEVQAAADDWVTDYDHNIDHMSPCVKYRLRSTRKGSLTVNLYTYNLSTEPVSLRKRPVNPSS